MNNLVTDAPLSRKLDAGDIKLENSTIKTLTIKIPI